MATSREIVELLTQFITQGEKQTADAFDDIAASQAQLTEQAKRLQAEMRDVARAMDQGVVSVEEGTEQYNKLQRELDQTESKMDSLNQETNDSSTRFTELASKLSLAQEAFSGVQKVAEVTLQTIQRGAEVQQVANTFDNLTDSIGSTSEVMIKDLRAATAGMVSDFDLMSNANTFMAMGLAETSEEAAELAKVATQLGSAMGSGPNEAMENFALLLANQSLPRLDSFGISSGKVRERINELTTGINALDRETAFMQATMEEAEKTMVAVGDASDTLAGDMARLEAGSANLRDRFSVAFSKQWAPIIGGLSDTVNAYTATQEEMNRAVKLGIVTQEEAQLAIQNAALGFQNGKDDLARYRQELEEFDERVKFNTVSMGDSADMYAQAGQEMSAYAESVEEATDEVERSTDMADRYAAAGQEMSEVSERAANQFRFQAEQAALAADAQQGLIDTSQEAAGIIEEGYGAAAQAAEDSTDRQLAADTELKDQLIASVLEIAEARILAQGGDALGNLEEFLGLQESMGTLTQEEADKRLEQAENTLQAAEVTQQLMNVYLNDGVLAAEEADRLATVTDLIGENAELTTDQLITLGVQGTEHAGMVTEAFDATDESIITATGSVDTLHEKLANLPEEIVVHVRVETTGEVPNVSGAGVTSGVMEESGVN